MTQEKDYAYSENIKNIVLFVQGEFELKEKAIKAYQEQDNASFLKIIGQVIDEIALTANITKQEADDALADYMKNLMKDKRYGIMERK